MQSPHPVPIESRALGTLSYIRSSIDAASSLAVPGLAGIVMGGIGIGAAALATFTPLGKHWLLLWLIAAVPAVICGVALMARQATQRGALRFGPFRKFLLCLCPALLAGAALTLVLWSAGQEQLIAGTWLLLYGCAVIAASTVTCARNLPLIASMGAVFIALSLATFAMPIGMHKFTLGAGFGAAHLLFGVLIGRANRVDD